MRIERPTSVGDALSLLAEDPDETRLIAGGTALVTMMKQGLVRPSTLVSLHRIEDLRGSHAADDGWWEIGALASQRSVQDGLPEDLRALTMALASASNPRVRHVATLGGALAHADPNQDTIIALLALNSEVELASVRGARRVPLDQFFVDYYETGLEPDEMVTRIFVPRWPGARSTFMKFLPRSVDDYGVVNVAVRLQATADESGVPQCRAASIALGCLGDTPLRATAAEAIVANAPLDATHIAAAAEAVLPVVDPVSDARGSAAYKRRMAGVFVRRALQDCADAAGT